MCRIPIANRLAAALLLAAALMPMAAMAQSASDTLSPLPVRADTVVSDTLGTALPADTLRLPDTLVLALTGDIMMGTTFPTVRLPAHGGRDVFRDTRHITLRADLALGNLEGTLLNGGKSTKGNGPNSYSFRTPPSFARWLAEAGYDYLSQANNHANDFGPDGIRSTERALDSLGIAYSGIVGRRESAVVVRNGVRYGICAFGHNRYTLRHTDLPTVERILTELRPQCDILVVSVHGGAEGKDKRHLPHGTEIFLGENRGALRDLARFCIDHGADVVFGHGPHVVRAMEVYKGRFVAYSLGNFCTPYGMNLSGVSGYAPVVEIRIGRDGHFIEGQVHSFVQQPGQGPRADAANVVAREMRALSLDDCPASPLRVEPDGRMWVQP